MVGRAVKENQVTAQQMWSRGRVLTMPVCLFSHFSQMTPAALAAPTALTFRNSPLPPAMLCLWHLQGRCMKSRKLINSAHWGSPHPVGERLCWGQPSLQGDFQRATGWAISLPLYAKSFPH